MLPPYTRSFSNVWANARRMCSTVENVWKHRGNQYVTCVNCPSLNVSTVLPMTRNAGSARVAKKPSENIAAQHSHVRITKTYAHVGTNARSHDHGRDRHIGISLMAGSTSSERPT